MFSLIDSAMRNRPSKTQSSGSPRKTLCCRACRSVVGVVGATRPIRETKLGWGRALVLALVVGLSLVLVGGGGRVRAAEADPGIGAALPIESRVTHHFATNAGVRLHYASLGRGPLVVLVHGFPDCWLTWTSA